MREFSFPGYFSCLLVLGGSWCPWGCWVSSLHSICHPHLVTWPQGHHCNVQHPKTGETLACNFTKKLWLQTQSRLGIKQQDIKYPSISGNFFSGLVPKILLFGKQTGMLNNIFLVRKNYFLYMIFSINLFMMLMLEWHPDHEKINIKY